MLNVLFQVGQDPLLSVQAKSKCTGGLRPDSNDIYTSILPRPVVPLVDVWLFLMNYHSFPSNTITTR